MIDSITICSGGADSVTLATYLHKIDRSQILVSFDYGQTHDKEIIFAKELAKDLGLDHRTVRIPFYAELGIGSAILKSPEGDNVIPYGHYTDDSMKKTVVPNRNAIFLSIAFALAVEYEAGAVYYGAHAGDHTIYPDCRPSFVAAMATALRLGTDTNIEIVAPFVRMKKAEIIKIGHDLGVDYRKTWTCYEGLQYHCGKCGACVERREAFSINGIIDPTIYFDTIEKEGEQNE